MTREAARALGRLDRDRHARSRANAAISPSGTSSARPSSSTASASIRSGGGSGGAHGDPEAGAADAAPTGDASISARRRRSIRPAARTSRRAPPTVEAILGKGEPVYGINTGFGKLASVRIERDDLERLQRNIVLSHAAGVGEPLPDRVVRLVMALKIASLSQGASGIRWATLDRLAAAAFARTCCRSSRRRAPSAPPATSRRSPISRRS